MNSTVFTVYVLFICVTLTPSFAALLGNNYILNDEVGLGRVFDGIGAISGGGATSKLLVNYPEPQRSQILDYLFKPKWGASLHILKVEIGGDSQSSEGTESSHQHTASDDSYQRGYEWWLMKEAKKRNPGIKLYGLPWGFPSWLSDGAWWPYRYPDRTAAYIADWILGAKAVHGLQIDYIGIWNEKPYDITYIKTLRRTLDIRGLSSVRIVAADLIGYDSWDVVDDVISDPEFAASVDIIGGHYTGTWTTSDAKNCGKPLWSSEDYSTGDDERGGGCMARLLNQNYVNGYMTSTIAWNLIYSYYSHLPYAPVGLMTAQEPWGGHYDVKSPIWTTAHTTQFTQPGWRYLLHRSGVGKLKDGGTYVTLVSPDMVHTTVVIETMNMENSDFCLRPPQMPYVVKPQNITLQLEGHLSNISRFEVWLTRIGLGIHASTYFKHQGNILVKNGRLTLFADINSVITLTTLITGHHGTIDDPIPPPRAFPHPYKDDFEGYVANGEPYNFAQQVGVFEVVQSASRNHSKVIQQVVVDPPIFWCPLRQTIPLNVIGDYNWSDMFVQADVNIPASRDQAAGVYLATRVDRGGCVTFFTRGVFFFLHYSTGTVELTLDLPQSQSVVKKPLPLNHDCWYTVGLKVKLNHVSCYINQQVIFDVELRADVNKNGFTALGAENFGIAQFDNFQVDVL